MIGPPSHSSHRYHKLFEAARASGRDSQRIGGPSPKGRASARA